MNFLGSQTALQNDSMNEDDGGSILAIQWSLLIKSELHLTVEEAPVIQDRQQEVAAALLRAQQNGEVAFDRRPEDIEEEALTEQYSREGCSCSHGQDGQPCCKSFPISHYREYRDACLEMTRDQLDMVIMGQMAALTYNSSHSLHRRQYQERHRETTKFLHHQQVIYQSTFCFLHTVGKKAIQGDQEALLNQWPCPKGTWQHWQTKG